MVQNQPKQKEVTKWFRTNLNNNYKQEITWIFFNIQVNFTSIRVSKFHKKGNITYKVMKSQSTTAPMLLSMEEQKSFWGVNKSKMHSKGKSDHNVRASMIPSKNNNTQWNSDVYLVPQKIRGKIRKTLTFSTFTNTTIWLIEIRPNQTSRKHFFFTFH